MMNELMRQEILDQPEAVSLCLPSLRGQVPGILPVPESIHRVIFSGSGDSLTGPLALQFAAETLQPQAVHVLPPLTAARFFQFRPGDLLFAVSISGEAVRTIEAARSAQGAGACVTTITANPESTLARTGDACLTIDWKSRSRKTPHTTDYSTTLLASAACIEHLANTPLPFLDALPDLLVKTVPALETTCREIGEQLAASERFFILGGGPNFGTAYYAAAKFWEAGGLEAYYSDLEEFAHGPHLIVSRGEPVMIVAPQGRTVSRALEIINGLKDIGAEIIVITDDPGEFAGNRTVLVPQVDELWSPFVTCIPLQWLCWSFATAKGYDVIVKNGRRGNPAVHDDAHMRWVRKGQA